MKMRYTQDDKIQLTMSIEQFANIYTALMVASNELAPGPISETFTNTLQSIKNARHVATSL